MAQDPPESEEAIRHPKTYAEYLELEDTSEIKHEFLEGEIVAMAGGTPEHGRLAMNLGAELRIKLRGRSCKVLSSDVRVRVRVGESNKGLYPDLSVVCGPIETDPADKTSIVNPVVLVEVLSPKTEEKDRGSKFERYKRLPSLKEYVLVSQDEPCIEVFRRQDDGSWPSTVARAGERVNLGSIKCEVSVDAVYAE